MRTILFLFAVLFSVAGYGQQQMLLRGAAAGTTGILDGYTFDAAYCSCLLITGYSGPILRIRRASDNAETDIEASGQGIDEATIISHCTGTDCFVTTAYDQTGGGNPAINTTAAAQPKIYDSVTGIMELNGEPAMYSAGNVSLYAVVNPFPATGDISLSIYGVQSITTTGNAGQLVGVLPSVAGTDRRQVGVYSEDNGTTRSVRLAGGFTSYTSSLTGQLVFGSTYAAGGGAFDLNLDGTALSVGSFGNAGLNIQSNSAWSIFNVYTTGSGGIYTDLSPYTGYVQAAVFSVSDQSSDTAAIVAALNSYFNSY